jgi:hypothetical protein
MILLLSIGAAPGIGHSADCMDRFPEGRFGISLSHPAAAGVVRAAFTPLYLVKQSVTISRPEDCQYVYTHDVFRLPGTGRPAPCWRAASVTSTVTGASTSRS